MLMSMINRIYCFNEGQQVLKYENLHFVYQKIKCFKIRKCTCQSILNTSFCYDEKSEIFSFYEARLNLAHLKPSETKRERKKIYDILFKFIQTKPTKKKQRQKMPIFFHSFFLSSASFALFFHSFKFMHSLFLQMVSISNVKSLIVPAYYVEKVLCNRRERN